MNNRREFCRTAAALSGGTLLLSGLVAAPAQGAQRRVGAKVVRERWIGPQTLDLTVHSLAMGRAFNVRLVVPKGWSKNATRRWPVVWALHGGACFYTAWSGNTDIVDFVSRQPVLLVMPEGGFAGGYTDWWNFGLGGFPAWETFHLAELRPLLERQYRAGTRRAVFGQSTGGFGAMIYSARHPGMFAMAASFSGFLSTLLPGVPQVLMNGIGPVIHPHALWGDPLFQRRIWQSHDPYHQAKRLRGTRLYVSCAKQGARGPLDPPDYNFFDAAEAFIHYTTTPFLTKLKQLGIPVTTHLYPTGTHSWPYWERELHRAWPMIMQALRA